MGDFLENIFWIIIILVWISSIFSKAKKTSQSKERVTPAKPRFYGQSDFEKQILKNFGFVFPQKYEAPRPKVREIPPKKKEKQLELKESPRYKARPTPESVVVKTVKQETPTFILNTEKLEEGIILAEILGPPKAYQFCRGVGTGIRSGLKNRWA